MIHPYEKILRKQIYNIECFEYENIKILEQYPINIAEGVLKVLIENACLAQNCAVIELGRKKISEINKQWLERHFLRVAVSCINFEDEWEYRRLLELIVCVIPELKSSALKFCEDSDNEDIREVLEDYKDT